MAIGSESFLIRKNKSSNAANNVPLIVWCHKENHAIFQFQRLLLLGVYVIVLATILKVTMVIRHTQTIHRLRGMLNITAEENNITNSQFANSSLHQNIKNVCELTKPITVVEENCTKPVTEVFYLRTFKTGSSTITSMLYRFIWKHNLTIVPLLWDTFPDTITDHKVEKPLGNLTNETKYDLLAEHIRFDHKAVQKYVKPDAKFIVSLRHPMAHYKSVVYEFRLPQMFHISDIDPALTILKNLKRYSIYYPGIRQMGVTKSLLTYQLGLDRDLLDNITAVDNFILETDKSFDFVIINEYFDESLILLRRKFCWQTKDIYYLVKRPGRYKYKTSFYDESIRKIHETWSAADYKLYYYFLTKLLSELEMMPQDFWDELAQYRITNTKIAEFCDPLEEKLKQNTSAIYGFLGNWETGEGKLSITIDPSPWGDPFEVDPVDCAFLKFDTIMMRNMLRLLNHKEYCSYKRQEHILQHGFHVKYDYKRQKVIEMNSDYCMDWSNHFNVPLKLFSNRKSYMWQYP